MLSPSSFSGHNLAVLAFVGVMVGALVLLARHIVAVPLHRVGILSGRRRHLPDGTVVGYRIVSGWAFRLPIVEVFDLMPDMPGEVEMTFWRIVLRDGSVFDVVLRTEVSFVRGDGLRHAVERFLGQSTATMNRVASQLLEGAARQVLAELTRSALEAAATDVDSSLGSAIAQRATGDLAAVGLVVENTALAAIIPEPGQAYR